MTTKATKKALLKQELELLEKVLALKEQKNKKMIRQSSLGQFVYASPEMTLGFRKKGKKIAENLTKQAAWLKNINEAKMVRSAKALFKQFNQDVVGCSNDVALEIIESLNKSGSNLTPRASFVSKIIDNAFDSYLLTFSGLYSNFFHHIFQQGRLHQTLFMQKDVILKKFSNYNISESTEADRIQLALNNDFKIYYTALKNDLIELTRVLIKSKITKANLCENINESLEQFKNSLQELTHFHLREAYLAGNLYQLTKDGVESVYWKCGEHINDCSECRAIENGDSILLDDHKNAVPHQRDMLGAPAYSLKAINEIAKRKGASFFNHDGCRCAFIPKKSI